MAEFLGMLAQMVGENGIGWNIKQAVVVSNDEGQPMEILKTPAQLMADLISSQTAQIDAIEALTQAVWTTSQIALRQAGKTWDDIGIDDPDHEEEFPTEDEAPPPRRKRR